MRWLLALLVALLTSSPAAAAIAHVQSTSVEDVSGNLWVTASLGQTLTFSGAVTIGNTVVAWTTYGTPSRTMACTLDGNAMTEVAAANTTTGGLVRIYARVATTTGQAVICTISANDNGTQQGFAIAEFSGTAATLSTSGGAGVSATTASEITVANTTHDSGADLTPDTADNLFVGAAFWGNTTGTVGLDGYTAVLNGSLSLCAYKIQSAATANDFAPTTVNSITSEVGLANLDGAAGGGGGGGGTGKMLLLGVGP